jgi:hypothetical protein
MSYGEYDFGIERNEFYESDYNDNFVEFPVDSSEEDYVIGTFPSSMYSYEEIAEDYDLWEAYVDPIGSMSEEFFDAMTIEEKVRLQEVIFGKKGN